MVHIEEHKIVITINLDKEDSQTFLDILRESITDLTSIVVESDELYNFEELPRAVATLIKLQGELFDDGLSVEKR